MAKFGSGPHRIRNELQLGNAVLEAQASRALHLLHLNNRSCFASTVADNLNSNWMGKRSFLSARSQAGAAGAWEQVGASPFGAGRTVVLAHKHLGQIFMKSSLDL